MGELQLKASDQLRPVAQQIRDYLQEKGITVFSGGDCGDNNIEQVYWKQQNEGDWVSFLQCAQELGAKPIYFFVLEFSDLDLIDAPSRAVERRFKNKVGQICVLELSFYFNGLMHSYRMVPSWFGEWENLTEFEFDMDEANDAGLNDIPF